MEVPEQKLANMVRAFAKGLREAFPLVPARDTKRAVMKMLQHELPPHRGRPKAQHLDQAEQLQARGFTYRAICHAINPRFDSLSQSEKLFYRESVKQGLKARRARKNLSPGTK